MAVYVQEGDAGIWYHTRVWGSTSGPTRWAATLSWDYL